MNFQKRRQQLMNMVEPNSLIIIPSASPSIRSRDIEYRYRQNSDFYYLNGFPEPNAVMVLIPERSEGEFVLFCQERNQTKEQWDGERVGPDGAMKNYGVDDAYPIDEIDDILPTLLKNKEYIYHPMQRNDQFELKIKAWININKLQKKPITPEIISLDHLLHDMRLFKTKAEISAMKRAAKIAVKAHENAMKAAQPNMYEYELEAEYIYEFKKSNASHSYNPIVGSGINACILHYVENNKLLKDGDLVLIDAGCELNYYASDITRTFPVNGRFSEAQLDIYNIVLEAQLSAIDEVKKGNHFNDPHRVAVRIITQGLIDVGLLSGNINQLIDIEAYRRFFMHRTGHWIGMDVHDVGDYKVDDEWRTLENGMVTTIEPGIYIGSESDIPIKYRNIGIRIEDMVVVNNESPIVLSQSLVKNPTEIEVMMSNS
ncbi:MAG: aminopeptidase P N-terminal domain-containing protein [Woeseiaceae bacterium]|nr:aminopeptidase P N-terminal domain-containing protein [Woeseiaceae bacterium]